MAALPPPHRLQGFRLDAAIALKAKRSSQPTRSTPGPAYEACRYFFVLIPDPACPSRLAGGLLLAFWLGWTALALGYLRPSRRQPGDPRQAELLLADTLARLPAADGPGPLAIRLDAAATANPPMTWHGRHWRRGYAPPVAAP